MDTKKKAIDPSRLLIIHFMTTVNKTWLPMQKMQKNGQNILRGKIFRINGWQLISDIEIGQ